MADYPDEPTESQGLPVDILIDIFLQFPVKTLVRLTSVCRLWNSIIRRSDFINFHLSRSSALHNDDDDRYILVTRLGRKSFPDNYVFSLNQNTFARHANFDFPIDCFYPYVRIVGSCKGLVCLVMAHHITKHSYRVYLWNPCVGKFKFLPPSCVPLQSRLLTSVAIGFGYDPRTNDFKVIRLQFFNLLVSSKHVRTAQVYSLSTNSWRRIPFDFPWRIHTESVAFVNGATHWLGQTEDFGSANHVIISFEFGDEMFRVISLPRNYFTCYYFRDRVMVFKGSLSLYMYPRGDHSSSIWVMKEYGVSESWTQIISIHWGTIERPLAITRDGKLILEILDSRLFYYDLKKPKLHDLCVSQRGYHEVDTNFMESLVLFDEGNAM